jgi:hypothetical protein
VPVDVLGLNADVVAITAGGFHTCALLKSGDAKCWGRNDAGQLGDGSAINRRAPSDVFGLSGDVATISAGGGDGFGEHTCAVTDSGAVKCWGRNDFGQLGNGTTSNNITPADVAGLAAGAVEVDGGRYHTCARTTSSGAKCWGWNIGGQLGNGTFDSSSYPVDVISLGSAAGLPVGGMHVCAEMSSSRVRCWGFNNVGQLGSGTAGGNQAVPGDVLEEPGGPALSDVIDVTAGGGVSNGGHTCALLRDGTIMCWGENGSGQLGDGTTLQRNSPVSVLGFDTPDPTATSTETDTPSPTHTPAPTDTPPPTETKAPTATLTPEPTNTAVPTRTNTPVPTATNSPVPPATATSPAEDDVWSLMVALNESVEALSIPQNHKRHLLHTLDQAERALERERPCHALIQMHVFMVKVWALKQQRRISSETAEDLMEQAGEIIQAIWPDCRRPRH